MNEPPFDFDNPFRRAVCQGCFLYHLAKATDGYCTCEKFLSAWEYAEKHFTKDKEAVSGGDTQVGG